MHRNKYIETQPQFEAQYETETETC